MRITEVYRRKTTPEGWIEIGEIGRTIFGQQNQYFARYFEMPEIVKDLRVNGDPADYHSWSIHPDDKDKFVERVREHSKSKGLAEADTPPSPKPEDPVKQEIKAEVTKRTGSARTNFAQEYQRRSARQAEINELSKQGTSELNIKEAIIKIAEDDNKAYPQFHGKWKGKDWRVMRCNHRVKTKGYPAAERGDLVLAKKEPAQEHEKHKGDERVTFYSIRNAVDTISMKAKSFVPLSTVTESKTEIKKLFKKGGFLKWNNITNKEAREAGIAPNDLVPATLNQTYDKKILGLRIDGRPYLLNEGHPGFDSYYTVRRAGGYEEYEVAKFSDRKEPEYVEWVKKKDDKNFESSSHSFRKMGQLDKSIVIVKQFIADGEPDLVYYTVEEKPKRHAVKHKMGGEGPQPDMFSEGRLGDLQAELTRLKVPSFHMNAVMNAATQASSYTDFVSMLRKRELLLKHGNEGMEEIYRTVRSMMKRTS